MPYDGYGTYDPEEIPLARPSDAILVCRMTVAERGFDEPQWSLEPLLNVVPVTITIREGAYAPSATFRYIFDEDLAPLYLPSRFHHVYGHTSKKPGVVQVDDRLVVLRAIGENNWIYMFDGFVTSPQSRVDSTSEHCLIVAMGTPHREWDYVLGGSVWAREMSVPGEQADEVFFTDVPARFNPNGKPNECAEGEEMTGRFYFTDVPIPRFVSVKPDDEYEIDGVTKRTRHFTVGTAAQYVVGMGIEGPLGLNPQGEILRPTYMLHYGPYVSVYDINAWPERLKSLVPREDGKPINVADPTTYYKNDIKCPDVEVTGEAWPNALEKLIKPYGFNFRFDLRVASSATWQNYMPEWYLTVYRVDEDRNRVKVYLQEVGDVYNPGRTNVAEVDISRDAYHVGNEFDVDTNPVEYEATFLLVPAFQPLAGDITDLEEWDGENEDPDKRKSYRRYIFGESGEKYWNGTAMVTQGGDSLGTAIQDMDDLFNLIYDKNKDRDFRKRWARRARPPLGKLLTLDENNEPSWCRLDVTNATNMTTAGLRAPQIWNGGGTWQRVTSTHWKVLDDSIGIELLGRNINEWHSGKPREGDTIVFEDKDDGVLNLVEMLNSSDPDEKPVFALTCVIQSDADIDAFVRARKSSLTTFNIRRKIDAKGRWKKQIVTKFSMAARDDPTLDIVFNGGTDYLKARDDTDEAKDGAAAYQRAHECGSHGGSFVIRRITTAYNVGQVVTGIVGRNVDLRINAGAPDGETPLYPRIQSITWNFDGEQTTTLNLTDERSDPITRRMSLSLRPGRQR